MTSSKNLFNLNGKIALVAGSSRGIGYTFTEYLRKHKAKVIGLSRNKNKNPFLDLHYLCDVKNKSELNSTKNHLMKNNLKLDIIIYTAGITSSETKLNQSENFSEVLKTNLVSNYNFINTFESILNDNSSIINISSINAIKGFPKNPAYVASKGGVEALTRALAVDLSKRNIRVNCIRPGYIKTDMTIKSFNNITQNENRTNKTILKRWGNTKDLVGPMLLLASDASSYMTGSILTVDGGWTALGLDE